MNKPNGHDDDPAAERMDQVDEAVIAAMRAAIPIADPERREAVLQAALLTDDEYNFQRRALAKQIGYVVGVLNKYVTAARIVGGLATAQDETAGSGRALEWPVTEPWYEPVDGPGLLEELAATFHRYVIMSVACAVALALWAIHAHAFEASPITPRLQIKSPVKRCGKTTVLEILQTLVRRPLMAANVTAAAVFRTIEVARPTLLIDEADTFLPEAEELRGVLNSGHRQAGEVIRTVAVGDNHEPRRFSTWAPTAIAAIGKLPGTLEDRSIQITLKRRMPTEKIQRWRFDHAQRDLGPLVRRCARWVEDNLEDLRAAEPAVPEQLHDRAADNWRPLLAIADRAGGRWPAIARTAAETLSSGTEDDGRGPMLLADLRDMFPLDQPHIDWLPTKELINKLTALEERPWPTICRGDKPISVQKLGAMLKAFGIYSTHNTEKTGRGYKRDALEDAWARYACESPIGGADDPSIRPETSSGAASEQNTIRPDRELTRPDDLRSGRIVDSDFPSTHAASGRMDGSFPPDMGDDDVDIRI